MPLNNSALYNKTLLVGKYFHWPLIWILGASAAPFAAGSQVEATITGTVASGTNGYFSGSGKIFGAAYMLDGLPFILTYTFDDTKGKETNYYSYTGGPIYKSDYTSPTKAVLQIGGVSYTFPTFPTAEATRWAGTAGSGGASFSASIQDEVDDSEVNALYYVETPNLSLNYSWESPFIDPQVTCCVYDFNISVKTADGSLSASGSLNATSIAVSGPLPCSGVVALSSRDGLHADENICEPANSLNNIVVSRSIDRSDWELVHVTEDSYTVKTGDMIALVASSLATPPTCQFYFTAFAQPLTSDGSIQDVVTAPDSPWLEPVQYSTITGVMVEGEFILQATFQVPGDRQQWKIMIPPREATHGSCDSQQIEVYVARPGHSTGPAQEPESR